MNSFYDSLIDWPAVEQAVLLVREEEEKDLALSSIMHALETVVHIVLFHSLPSEMHAQIAVQLDQHHQDPSVLEWLEKQKPGVTTILRDQLALTVQDIHRLLKEG